jgi:hypothetical protein
MDDAEFRCPDGRVHLIRVDGAGKLTSVAKLHAGDVAAHQQAVPDSIALLATEAELLDGTFDWSFRDGQLVKEQPVVVPLGSLITEGQDRIDLEAERARRAWLTPGVGQALEYQETVAQARGALAAPDPLQPADYPFLAADQDAHAGAGASVTLRQVAQHVMARQAAWLAAAASIKRVRLTAKRRIAAATTQAEIDVILAGVGWPIPPASATEGQ